MSYFCPFPVIHPLQSRRRGSVEHPFERILKLHRARKNFWHGIITAEKACLRQPKDDLIAPAGKWHETELIIRVIPCPSVVKGILRFFAAGKISGIHEIRG
jgi:hypothetical protein